MCRVPTSLSRVSASPAQEPLAKGNDASGNELEIVRLVGDGAIAKLPYDLRVLQEKDARHLSAVFFDLPDSMPEDRAFQPPLPNHRLYQVQPGVQA